MVIYQFRFRTVCDYQILCVSIIKYPLWLIRLLNPISMFIVCVFKTGFVVYPFSGRVAEWTRVPWQRHGAWRHGRWCDVVSAGHVASLHAVDWALATTHMITNKEHPKDTERTCMYHTYIYTAIYIYIYIYTCICMARERERERHRARDMCYDIWCRKETL